MNPISNFKRSKVAQLVLLFLLCNLTLSCANKEIVGDLLSQTQNTKYEFEFDFSHPDKVREFLTAHELNPKQPVIEKEMDMFNNDQGIRSARGLLEKRSFTDKEFFDAAINEIKSGNLKVLNYDDKQKRY